MFFPASQLFSFYFLLVETNLFKHCVSRCKKLGWQRTHECMTQITMDLLFILFICKNNQYLLKINNRLGKMISGTIYNILTILCAVMTDRKILFRSSSLSLLADSCYALRSLLYPFDYP